MKDRFYIVICLVLVGAVVALVTLAGCGGDTGKAKEYMNNADSIIEGMEADTEQMGTDIQNLFMGMEAGRITTSAQFKSEATEIKELIDELSEEAKKAKAEYEKILDLKGVDDYAEYAQLRMDIIDNNIQIAQGISTFLADIEGALAAIEAGQTIDQTDLQQKSTEFAEEVEELSKDNDELDSQAEELKKEKNL